MKAIPPSAPRSPIPPRPLSAPPAPITLPATPIASVLRDQARTEEMPAHPPSVAPVFAPYVTSAPLSRDWYVYMADGRHLGPLSTDFLARGWVAGQIPQNIFLGTAGEAGWRPIVQVPEIMEAARALQEWNQTASQSMR